MASKYRSTKRSTRTIVRKGYTARRGSKVVYVPPSRIVDRGSPGRWTTVNRSRGIGNLRRGRLSSVGYSAEMSPMARHRAIQSAVRAYGSLPTQRMLQAVATYTKRTSPAKSRVFESDVRYVQGLRSRM